MELEAQQVIAAAGTGLRGLVLQDAIGIYGTVRIPDEALGYI